jgi:ADP-heptose:LPS heptosyltransferase
MVDLYFVPGGIGKCISFTSLLARLDSPVGVCSGWKSLYEDHPKVYGSYDMTSFYEPEKNEYFSSYFDNFIYLDPYYSQHFLKQKKHISECFQLMRGIDMPTKQSEVFFNSKDIEDLSSIINKVDPFVLVQFSGSDDTFLKENDLYTRSLNRKQAQEIINILNFDLKLNVINVKNPEDTSTYENLCEIQHTLDFKKYMILLSFSRGFIGVDSFLQHASSNKNKIVNGVVLWGSTSSKLFGYEHNINLQTKAPYKMIFKTNEIMDSFSSLNKVEETNRMTSTLKVNAS